MSTGPTWAAIFDWDGVILDSSRQHEESWKLLARENGLPLPPDFFRRSFGMKNERIIPELFGWTRDPQRVRELGERKEALYRELIRRDGVQPLPGVRQWLDTLRAAAVPCAIGSSTPRENIDCVMDALGLREFFRAIVAGQDVTHGKPHPEVFLRAAERLGVPPARCVVFEDAHVGLEAARAAGMKVVGVATTHPAESLRDADRVVRRLDELSVEEIAAWFGAGTPR
ncbi:MAG: beta-phosphoglucomutase family hydrolase [Verrucomicrobiae bacterium]|nr:beta-phosphoglucomutase family hydrolase [Verrucomicrobiae bacterium]